MSDSYESVDEQNALVDEAVAEGGAYEIIRKRLVTQGNQLAESIKVLNQARVDEFGSTEMSLTARVRIRTENNCVGRDIVQVGEFLIFGYNVFIGLKKETKIDDVFSVFRFVKDSGAAELEEVKLENSFLSDPSFVNDFDELYRYYKHTKLVQLTHKNGKLLAGFQIGEKLEDKRVFRWSVSSDAKEIKYIDNRGERDIELPPSYDFEWTPVLREDTVHGRHPHANILDAVFVETIGGDLTVKIENNTEDGLGIFREPVEDKTQSLDDAQIFYAEVGKLILLKIQPYREETWRYLVFNKLTQDVLRIDALGHSCVQLPEDHGIIFPGGYYLETGEYKTFDMEVEGLRFKRSIKSPNGEDMLFIFYEPVEGIIGLFAYNLIEKQLQNPLYGHGYALAESGQMVIFSAESEPTRVHPIQVWQTPYATAEFASRTPESQTFYGRIGNADLVRGVSDLFSICRMIDSQSVSLRLYEELSKGSTKIFDDHYWLSEEQTTEIANVLKEISATAELVIDEFEKVESIREQSARALLEAEREHEELIQSLRPENWETVDEYVQSLGKVRRQRGHLVTLREQRYINLERISELDETLQQAESTLSDQTVEYLADEKSMEPYAKKIKDLNKEIEGADTVVKIQPLLESIEETASGLDLLSELMSTLNVDDATLQTRIIEAVSQVYSSLNQSRANARHKQKDLGSSEAVAQFGAQFKLFSQSITNALGLSDTPEKCDEQLSKLLVQLEELESQFSEFDQFLTDILVKREEVYESFESHKQQLLDNRQRRAQSLVDAADRMLSSIEKRSLKFTDQDEINTYFGADALVAKTRDIVEQLRELNSAVKADDIESRFKAIKEQAVRSQRDKSDIYEDGGNVIKLGPTHRFSVNTQELDLTIIPRDNDLYIHLTGTDYYEKIESEELLELRDYWGQSLESETDNVYRAEYLAAQIIESAESNQNNLSSNRLRESILDDELIAKIVKEYAEPRYKEGYEKGIHDHDAVLLLKQLIPAIERADLLRFDPYSRGLARVIWHGLQTLSKQAELNHLYDIDTWTDRAQSAKQLREVFSSNKAADLLVEEIAEVFTQFSEMQSFEVNELDIRKAARYLAAELSRDQLEFITSKYAIELVEEFKRSTNDETWSRFESSLKKLVSKPSQQWQLTRAWLNALIEQKELSALKRYIPEAIALINLESKLPQRPTEVDVQLHVENLMGEHPTIADRSLSFALDEFLQKMDEYRSVRVPAYHRYLEARQNVINAERNTMRLDEFKARPLSSFVRNRLINESYLPLIGDNLAKQMGTVGEGKRTDLMGLLMMISPPGYGKTTLMEYVANRLGLIFMKINCPSLGHDVMSLDPEQAPNATARQELNKLNLSLEMGNNVMLYLDDIQHTHPEFLQKFISLCDGSRRIEGVWKGNTKTYDMRGRKFCVVMAGNPYTESGETFKIPDMLANRADIYNLGDILGDMEEQFALSYVENSLTSNPVLAPLALRDMKDLYKLIDMAKGGNVATTDLSHQYSGAEINEITGIFKKMFVIQNVVLKINQQYIASSAQDDKYRTEPPFKLQGSYRNMNKMTEKITAVMNDQELSQMIDDHYQGEAQLLTTGAEANLLKLKELLGSLNETEQQRWQQILKDFMRNKQIGGGEVGDRVVTQLADLVEGVQGLTEVAVEGNKQSATSTSNPELEKAVDRLVSVLQKNTPQVEVINQPLPDVANAIDVLNKTLEAGVLPLSIVRGIYRSMRANRGRIQQLDNKVGEFEKQNGVASNKRGSSKATAAKKTVAKAPSAKAGTTRKAASSASKKPAPPTKTK